MKKSEHGLVKLCMKTSHIVARINILSEKPEMFLNYVFEKGKKKNMKKILAIILLLSVLSVFCSCGKDTDGSIVRVDENAVTEIAEERKAEEMPAAASFDSGTGTPEDPYVVANGAQLSLMCDKINDGTAESSHFVLKNDIEFNSTEDFSEWSVKAPKYKWNGINKFSGSFDGNGYTISGLYCYEIGTYMGIQDSAFTEENSTDSSYKMGFIRDLRGHVCNINISNSFFECLNNAAIGAIAGEIFEGAVTSCRLENVVVKSRLGEIGGLCGENYGIIEDIESDDNCLIELNESGYAGGICGFASRNITNCIARGNIVSGDTCGGLVGYASIITGTSTTFKNLQNYTKIETLNEENTRAGGCFGSVSTGLKNGNALLIDSCVNYSENIDGQISGGIVGYLYSDSISSIDIKNCVNEADTISDNKFGGVFGYIYVSKGTLNIISCINNGDIINNNNALGGIVSSVFLNGGETNIINCENRGSIKAIECQAGGILPTITISESEEDNPIKFNIIGCVNSGVIGDENGGISTGGIVGDIGGALGTVYSAENKINGILFSNEWDEFVIKDCVNRGKVISLVTKASSNFAGGIIGIWGDTVSSCRIENCVNEGIIEGVEPEVVEDYDGKKIECGIGGIAGLTNENIVMSGCSNSGTLKAPKYVLTGDLYASDRGLYNKVADD